MSRVAEVLEFWFGAPGSPDYGADREAWFKADPQFDAEIRDRFGDLVEAAAEGALDHWTESAEGTLALLILLDQFPRNLFRGSARAFAADPKAHAIAERAVDEGVDTALPPFQRTFVYLPFEHREDMAAQNRAVALFEALGDAKNLDYAHRHRDIIARFGRFPHRNAALGRDSTAEEIAFLEQPGSGF